MSTPGPNTLPGTNSRPRTHKPRGVCRYYQTPRGCFAGNNCKFLHGQEDAPEPQPVVAATGSSGSGSSKPLLTPYDQAKICRYYANGFCRRGDACWFKHTREGKDKEPVSPLGNESDDSESSLCSICYEQPTTFGLLAGCNHVFCIKCIKSWRDPSAKSIDMLGSGNTKSCPMCRTPSHFITPSSLFVQHNTPEKDQVIQSYKDSMARVPCRYFLKTRNSSTPICPFGKDCFYKHEKPDGSTHVFTDGADVCMRRYAARRAPRRPFMHHRTLFAYDDSDSEEGEFDDFFPPFDIELGAMSLLDFIPNIMGAAGRRRGEDHEDWPAGMQLGVPPPGDVEVAAGTLNDPANLGAMLTALETVRREREGNRAAGTQPTEDDEAQERIEILAEQMLTSLHVIRNRGNAFPHPRAQSGTPPPPLEPVNMPDDEAPNLITVSDSDDDEEEDEGDIYDNMPDLDTVSESSEGDDESYDTEGDEDDDDEHSETYSEVEAEEIHSMVREALGGDFEFEGGMESLTQGRSIFDILQGLRAASFPQAQEDSSDEDDDDVMPELERVSDISESGDEEEAPRAPVVPSPEPPYVTDGRGRVVWTSNTPPGQQPTPAPVVQPLARQTDPGPLEPTSVTEGPSSPQRPKAIMREPSHIRPRMVNATSNGFTTDGRGRVVGTGSGLNPHAQEYHPALGATLYSQLMGMGDSEGGQPRRLQLDEVD